MRVFMYRLNDRTFYNLSDTFEFFILTDEWFLRTFLLKWNNEEKIFEDDKRTDILPGFDYMQFWFEKEYWSKCMYKYSMNLKKKKLPFCAKIFILSFIIGSFSFSIVHKISHFPALCSPSIYRFVLSVI